MAEWQQAAGHLRQRRQEDLAIFAARQVIQTSGLPQVSQQRLLDRKYASAKEVEDAIEVERAYLAALTEGSVVNIGTDPTRGAAITGMRTGMDQIQLAFEALLAGTRPARWHPAVDRHPGAVSPALRGLRDDRRFPRRARSISPMSTLTPWPTWSPTP